MVENDVRYKQLDTICELADVPLTVSELHGVVVGAVTNHLKTGLKPDLLSLLISESDQQEKMPRIKPLMEAVYELYRDSSALFFEADERFDLLLGDGNESLPEKTSALGCWCKGYQLGLLYNDKFSIDQLGEDSAELIRDFMQIAEVEADLDDLDGQDFALEELCEYVKVGVQVVFESVYQSRAGETPNKVQ